MPDSRNKLSRFWQELKRRNVIRVITVYIAVAFMLLELVDMISGPFALPDWSMKVAFFILVTGLILAFILSYVYDVRTERTIVKTAATHEQKKDQLPKSSNSWKMASYISFAVIVGLIILNIVPGVKGSKAAATLDKSIAVMPFKYMSDEPDKQYLADGTMDAILLHLSRIKELRVISRTSVEQCRGTSKTATDICNELNVSYLLEGSFQKSGDQVRLIVQLIQSGNEAHVWANNYDREWKNSFAVQSEVAQLVAGELHVAITPEEKQRLERFPVYDLTAYEYYQKGLDEYWKDRVNLTPEKVRSIRKLFQNAIEHDSTLAPAYTGLAQLSFLGIYVNSDYFKEDFLDSALILANKAIELDPQLSEAFSIKGDYYAIRGMTDQAVLSYNKAIGLNPNNWNAYYGLASLYFDDDLLNSIDNFNKAILRYGGPVAVEMFFNLALSYYAAGIIDRGDHYSLEGLRVSGDSALYFHILGRRESMAGNSERALEFNESAHLTNTSHLMYMDALALSYTRTGQFQQAAKYWDKLILGMEAVGMNYVMNNQWIGYAHWMAGDRRKAHII